MFAKGMENIIGHEMAREREKLKENISAMERNLRKAKEQNDTPKEDTWTNSYKQWDCYEDIDELQAKIKAAKKDLSKLSDKIKSHNSNDSDKPCNHRYPCSCLGDKSAERKVVAMKTSERLEQMALFKMEGNSLHSQEKYRDSLALYEKALIYFEYCFDATGGECERASTLRLQCLLNAASCFLQLKLYPQCVEYCDDALEIDSRSTKAWFRRSRAHRLQEKFDIAEDDLAKAVESLSLNSPLRGDIRREMILLKVGKRRYKESSNKLATAMAGSIRARTDESISKHHSNHCP